MTRRRHPRVMWVDVLEASPLTRAGRIPAGRMSEVWDRSLPSPTPPPKETAMPAPTPVPPPPLPEYVTRREMNDTVDALTEMFTKALDELAATFEERLAAMPSGKADTGDRAVRFFESHPGVKFPAYAVAENIGGVGGKEIAGVLRRLAVAGRISVDNREGRHPLYFVKG